MHKNILVAKHNRIEIVFIEMQKKDKKHDNQMIAEYEVYTNKCSFVGVVWYPETMLFKDSFDILYEQLNNHVSDKIFDTDLKSKLAVKYHEDVV